jgi:hypothetical protein
MPDPLDRLRNATEDDVAAALEGVYVALPLTEHSLDRHLTDRQTYNTAHSSALAE